MPVLCFHMTCIVVQARDFGPVFSLPGRFGGMQKKDFEAFFRLV